MSQPAPIRDGPFPEDVPLTSAQLQVEGGVEGDENDLHAKNNKNENYKDTGKAKAVVTVVPVLPKTAYSDKKDTLPKSDAYISTQCAVLKWLDNHASDTLGPKLARAWTEKLDPEYGYPSTQDAVRLCYYMRELGFDTYCRMSPEKDEVALYIANPTKISRGMRSDLCYWKQNFKTGAILHGPLQDMPRRGGAVYRFSELPGNLAAGTVPTNHRATADELAAMYEGEQRHAREASVSPGSASPPPLRNSAQIQAEVELGRLHLQLEGMLSSPNYNPDELATLIADIEARTNEATL